MSQSQRQQAARHLQVSYDPRLLARYEGSYSSPCMSRLLLDEYHDPTIPAICSVLKSYLNIFVIHASGTMLHVVWLNDSSYPRRRRIPWR